MDKEPKELTDARNLLGKFEKIINQTDSIFLLGDALSLLEELTITVVPKTFKDIAKNICKTYAEKIFSQAQKVLPAADILETETIKHWSDMMGLFGDDVSEEFTSLRKQITKKWVSKFLEGLSIYQLEQLQKECEDEKNKSK